MVATMTGIKISHEETELTIPIHTLELLQALLKKGEGSNLPYTYTRQTIKWVRAEYKLGLKQAIDIVYYIENKDFIFLKEDKGDRNG